MAGQSRDTVHHLELVRGEVRQKDKKQKAESKKAAALVRLHRWCCRVSAVNPGCPALCRTARLSRPKVRAGAAAAGRRPRRRRWPSTPRLRTTSSLCRHEAALALCSSLAALALCLPLAALATATSRGVHCQDLAANTARSRSHCPPPVRCCTFGQAAVPPPPPPPTHPTDPQPCCAPHPSTPQILNLSTEGLQAGRYRCGSLRPPAPRNGPPAALNSSGLCAVPASVRPRTLARHRTGACGARRAHRSSSRAISSTAANHTPPPPPPPPPLPPARPGKRPPR